MAARSDSRLKWFFGITLLIFVSASHSDEITNKSKSSLVTGSLLGFVVSSTFLFSDGGSGYELSKNIALISGGTALGAGTFYFTRNLLPEYLEKPLYKTSYLYLGAEIFFIGGVVLGWYLIDKHIYEDYSEDKKPDLYIPIISLSTGAISAIVGGVLGYKNGHKIWLSL